MSKRDPVKDWQEQLEEVMRRLIAAERRLAEYDEAALNGRFPMQRLPNG